MPRSALSDFRQRKFSTKISTALVEIFDGFRDGNLTLNDAPLLLLGEFATIPAEVDQEVLAILVLPAYRLLEPGSPSPANCSQ